MKRNHCKKKPLFLVILTVQIIGAVKATTYGLGLLMRHPHKYVSDVASVGIFARNLVLLTVPGGQGIASGEIVA